MRSRERRRRTGGPIEVHSRVGVPCGSIVLTNPVLIAQRSVAIARCEQQSRVFGSSWRRARRIARRRETLVACCSSQRLRLPAARRREQRAARGAVNKSNVRCANRGRMRDGELVCRANMIDARRQIVGVTCRQARTLGARPASHVVVERAQSARGMRTPVVGLEMGPVEWPTAVRDFRTLLEVDLI